MQAYIYITKSSYKFLLIVIQVASFTAENHAINSYNKFLVHAYKSGVHEGIAAGLGLGTAMFIIFASYGLAIWFGGKMILEKGYTGGDVLNVIVAVLTGSMCDPFSQP